MINIGLIGAGGIGSRHLQGLALLKESANIYVVDLSESSLKVAKERVESIANSTVHNIVYAKSIDLFPATMDVVIIATGAAVRRKIIENLVATVNIGGLILEKILFQRVEDYTSVLELLASRGIKTWVNCPQRLYPGYKLVKNMIGSDDILEYSLIGSNWGLACNSIHYMDDLAYFTDCYDFSCNTTLLEKAIFPSKRDGYREYFGTITASSPRCKLATFTSFQMGNVPTMERIITENVRVEIYNNEQKMVVARASNSWIREELPFAIMYQSGLSDSYVADIVATGNCNLPTLSQSSMLHLPFITALLEFNGEIGEDTVICSIT